MKSIKTIFRRDAKKGGFTKVHNDILNSPGISGLAKSVLVWMLSKPDDWVFYQATLQKSFKEGRDALRRALAELERLGYVKRIPQMRTKGRFGSAGYTVHEIPLSPGQRSVPTGESVDGNAACGNAVDGESVDGEAATSKTNSSNTDETKDPLNPPGRGEFSF